MYGFGGECAEEGHCVGCKVWSVLYGCGVEDGMNRVEKSWQGNRQTDRKGEGEVESQNGKQSQLEL